MRLSIINSSIKVLKNEDTPTLAEGTVVYEAKGFVAGTIPVNVLIFDYKGRTSVDCYNIGHSYKAKDLIDVAQVSVKTTKHCFQGQEFDVNVIEVKHTFTTMLRRVINQWNTDLPFHKKYIDLHGIVWKNVYAKRKRRKTFYESFSAETILDKKLREIVKTGDFNDFSDE